MLRRPFLGSTASMARPREAQRHRGHTRSPVENARALLHVALLQERHSLSFDAAIKPPPPENLLLFPRCAKPRSSSLLQARCLSLTLPCAAAAIQTIR